MKHTITVALALLLALGLAGCSAQAASSAAVANPMHGHENKAALEKAVGFTALDISPDAGYTAQAYYDIDGKTAQIRLTNDAGDELTLRTRKGAKAEDISGVWGAGYTEKTVPVGGTELPMNVGSLKETEKETFVAWFSANDMVYSVSAFGPELTMEQFEALLSQLVLDV